MVVVGALAISGGAVAAAQYYASSKNAPAVLASAENAFQDDEWERALAQIQAESGISLPDTPSQGTIETLIADAQSDNLTDSIGRSLLVRLTNAGVQGLGDDIPTQDSIVAEAIGRINASQIAPKAPTLTLVESSDLTLRAYGNAVMQVFAGHPKASSEATYVAMAGAADTAQLAALAPIGREYKAIADELAALEVPRTLSPLHSQVVQNIYGIAAAYPDMSKAIDDPLRGVAALQKYQALMGEAGRILTNIAEALKKGGILFTKDEPGAAWDTFLSAS
ncbi:MAG: hypothetical protein JWL87_608 [Candidatus Adlerbacteria bacterium]|nr:hypothetical protein [Candidatus Adlerbacteria bacterium]